MTMTSVRRRLAHWLEDQWYRSGPVNPWLLPLSGVFAGAARLRRRAYLSGWTAMQRLPVPVIVIGNLTVGGTGKTPLAIWLVAFLRDAGYRPGVVSRGYGGERNLEAPMDVFPESDPVVAGDEPVLIAQRTGAPVVVAANRARGAQALLAEGVCNLIIADDGLQHYRLARDLEILLIDGDRQFGNGYCLPAGPLREPKERLASVDFIVRRGGAPEIGEYGMSVSGEDAVNLVTGERVPLTRFIGDPVHAMAGIANPERFFRGLRSLGLAIDAKRFPDHHRYAGNDIAFDGEGPILMTEKDAVKCRLFATPRHWYVPVEARLTPEFGPDLLQRLRAKFHG